MAPRVLFLDDDKSRHRKIKPYLLHDEAYTIADATRLLLEREYDIVFLDHDLGGEEMVDSDRADTGMEVAKFIVENKVNVNFIVVHSLNPVGATNMVTLLYNNGFNVMRVPFTKLPSVVDSILSKVAKNE